MKLWHSFTKELLLATRSFYFYVEIGMAGLFLFLLIFVIPETFDNKPTEYIHLNASPEVYATSIERMEAEDLDNHLEIVELDYDGKTVEALYSESEIGHYYLLGDPEAAIGIADKEGKFAGIVHKDDNGNSIYTYYMQGYETERLLNTYAVYHNEDFDVLTKTSDETDVRFLYENQVTLSDKENTLPAFLTFNGSLMGLFILASYIFLDKKEGVIKAYAVTPSPVWHYLLSKAAIVTVTSLITSLLITIPIMGTQPNYLAMIAFLLASGFAASAIGLLLTSFYDDIMQAFGTLYVLMIALFLPNIAYFIPTWSPAWIQAIPTYSMLESFKEALLPNGDINYILTTSAAYFAAGLALFFLANIRFKKTLSI